MKSFLLGGAALAFATAAHSATLVDSGFESQAGSVGSFCYLGTTCAAGAWTGASAGFQNETNVDWAGVQTQDGSHYAFIQNAGTLSQTFTPTTSGVFSLSWLDAGRPRSELVNGNETYRVTLAGAGINANLGTFSTTSYQPFTNRTSSPFSLVAGQSYTLTYTGLNTSGDSTAYIDAVSIGSLAAAVPEPSTWAMMLGGFVLMGGAVRHRNRKKVIA